MLGVLLGIGFGVAMMFALRDEGLEVISVPFGQLAVFLVLSLAMGVLAAVFPLAGRPGSTCCEAIATERAHRAGCRCPHPEGQTSRILQDQGAEPLPYPAPCGRGSDD